MGKSLKSFALDHLSYTVTDEFRKTRDIEDALNAAISQEFINTKGRLNIAQFQAFESIMKHIHEGRGGAFFIDGPGGTGKTILYNFLYAEVRMMNKIVLPTATSGIAASDLPLGRTAHSRFKIPVDHENSLTCDVPKQGSLANLIKETALIIWDEAPMANKANLQALDLLLQDICENTTLFGGKLVILGEDFRQILPIVPPKLQRQAIEASTMTSYIWTALTRFKLIENQRAREDPAFCSFLLYLSNGELQKSECDYVKLPDGAVQHFLVEEDPILDIINATFPEVKKGTITSNIFADRAILTRMNDDVDLVNSVLIDQFPGETVIYKSFDVMLNDTCNIYPTEFINKLCPGGMSPHELVLKKVCPVILLRKTL